MDDAYLVLGTTQGIVCAVLWVAGGVGLFVAAAVTGRARKRNRDE